MAPSLKMRLFQKVFGDAEGKPVGLKFWRYAKLLEDTRIPADGWRDEAWPLPAMPGALPEADIDSISAPTPSGSMMRCAPPSRACRSHP